MFIIPTAFADFMHELHGLQGIAWLQRLPTLLATYEQRWQLKIQPPFAGISFNYVAPAIRSDGTPVVLKANSPTGEFAHEAEAIRIFAGRGMVRLLEYDPADEIMLLERLLPGTPLSTLDDDITAISAAATTMRQLWRPVPSNHSFPSVSDWGKGFLRLRQHFGGGHGPFPPALLKQAETLFAELSTSMADPVLLHGDLHQDNILHAGGSLWQAIDPKGLIGEPAYETGVLLRNPLPSLLQSPHPARILAHRIDQLSEELGLDRARLHGWGLAQAVLASWWGFEDSGRPGTDTLACAELLAT